MCIKLHMEVGLCRKYNEFASSVCEESNKMKAVQKEAVARQVKLDEESLQRLKEAEAKDKVHCNSQSCFSPFEQEEDERLCLGHHTRSSCTQQQSGVWRGQSHKLWSLLNHCSYSW